MALLWRDHAVLKPPTPEELALMEPEGLVRLHKLFHEAIANSERDPYRYGFRPPHWDKAMELLADRTELVILGGNRSGKTSFAAETVVRSAMSNPNSVIWCFAQTGEVSISLQQPAVYKALPLEIREAGGFGYTKKNGFPKNSASKCSIFFENGSEVVFKAYSQFLNNDTILEGAELGSREATIPNLGAWCDEYLIGPELLEALRFRVLDRYGKILITFTPIDGYTEVVRDYLAGAKTTEYKTAELLNGDRVPFTQESTTRHAHIVYFHTQGNPFSGYSQMVKTLEGRPREEILTRAYGVPTKSIASKFPAFSREVNVIAHDSLPWVKDKAYPVTRYQILDPAGRKKWFMLWIAVDASETWWVHREWPDVSYGDWAVWRNGKWVEGPGAKPDGNDEGVADYVKMIKGFEAEDGGEVFERLIDPRLGASKYKSISGVSCTIEDLADCGMIFEPAPGIEIDDGLQALRNKMAYDRAKPIDANNRPRIYVSDRCENFIRSIAEYTGEEGKDEAWKDPLDCGRYAAVSEIRFIDPKWLVGQQQSRGGY
jgi:hypothetical protein